MWNPSTQSSSNKKLPVPHSDDVSHSRMELPWSTLVFWLMLHEQHIFVVILLNCNCLSHMRALHPLSCLSEKFWPTLQSLFWGPCSAVPGWQSCVRNIHPRLWAQLSGQFLESGPSANCTHWEFPKKEDAVHAEVESVRAGWDDFYTHSCLKVMRWEYSSGCRHSKLLKGWIIDDLHSLGIS